MKWLKLKLINLLLGTKINVSYCPINKKKIYFNAPDYYFKLAEFDVEELNRHYLIYL